MKRRDFLKHTTHSLAVPGLLSALSMPHNAMANWLQKAAESQKKLVLIFLDGGNDGLNTVVPLDQFSRLTSARPKVILPENKIMHLPGNEQLGFHPALEKLKILYGEGRLAIIQNVGYAHPNLSHFRSTDIWMSGSDSDQLVTNGWIGRYLESQHATFPEEYPNENYPDPLAIEIGYSSSLLLQGAAAPVGMVLSGTDSFYELIEQQNVTKVNSGIGNRINYINLMARQSQAYGQQVKSAYGKGNNKSTYPGGFLSEQLKIVARLINGGIQTPVFLVRLGGFDTHDRQVDLSDHTKGEHAMLLREVSDSIFAFQEDMDKSGKSDEIIGLTFSEFGRTIISNGSDGTDHGTSAPLFVFGNAVKGGVTGSNPIIPQNAVWDDDLTAQYDFRQIYASILTQWLGIDSSVASQVLFRGFEEIEIIGTSEIITSSSPISTNKISVFPNPVIDFATLRLENWKGDVEIILYDLYGRQMNTLHTTVTTRNLEIPLDISSMQPGYYLVSVNNRKNRKIFQFIKK